MTDTQTLIVLPCLLQKLFLKLAHDDSGHKGVDCTMSKLYGIAYWIGMGRRVQDPCKFCVKCQLCKAFPISSDGNRFLLMAQDYLFKRPFAMPMPVDQRIVQTLRDEVFT